MKKDTLNMYDTTIHVYEYPNHEVIDKLNEGNKYLQFDDMTLVMEGEALMMDLLLPEEDSDREASLKYAEGVVINKEDRTVEKLYCVIGLSIDSKQLSNIFTMLSVDQAFVATNIVALEKTKKPVQKKKAADKKPAKKSE